MWSADALKKAALVVGAAAIVGSGALVACSDKEKPAEPAPSAPTSAPSASPTEKVNVGSFTPTHKAPPPRTALPGNVITGN